MFGLICLVFFGCQKIDFPLSGMLFGFWVIRAPPSFISCCVPWEDVLVVSAFIQQSLAHKHMLLLMHINEQPRHKFMTSPTRSVLPKDLQDCSLQEAQPATSPKWYFVCLLRRLCKTYPHLNL